MLGNRLKQFREYNKISCEILAKLLGITETDYINFENDTTSPSILQIERLAFFYNVTVDEFYGFTPRLTLNSQPERPETDNDIVDESILKLSQLSWDEIQVLLHYRNSDNKEEVIKNIINEQDKK
ncbi:MAG: helix-turn-helix transcriptional regulator [Clostridia bacterium]|nr:helix-turn-helix transcriptional regulator [Clostridia bacterium]